MKKEKKIIRKEKGGVIRFKKRCIFCKEALSIDYKNLELLHRFINAKGRITSRRINGNCAKHQRKLAKAVKRARFLALLPYIVK